MQWNLEWLRTFKAIYETGTLSAAAQQLFISQPGVSLHLNSLETFTGYKLFDRSARKMLPTERGKILYNCIFDSLIKLAKAEEHFQKRNKNEKATISLGMCFEAFQYTLEEYIHTLPFNLIIKFGESVQMQQDLEAGLLDIIVCTNKGSQKSLQYRAFSKEQIVLVAGNKASSEELKVLLKKDDLTDASNYLRQQLWYSTAADMEYLEHFWFRNFKEHPDLAPNYIVPNINSVIRSLKNSEGYTVVPYFLCREALDSGDVQLVWRGTQPLENVLYFGTRKKTIYKDEIELLQKIFRKKWNVK